MIKQPGTTTTTTEQYSFGPVCHCWWLPGLISFVLMPQPFGRPPVVRPSSSGRYP